MLDQLNACLELPPPEKRRVTGKWWLKHFVASYMGLARDDTYIYVLVHRAALLPVLILVGLHWFSFLQGIRIPIGLTTIDLTGPNYVVDFTVSLSRLYMIYIYPLVTVYGLALGLKNLDLRRHDTLWWHPKYSLQKASHHRVLYWVLLAFPFVVLLPLALPGAAIWLLSHHHVFQNSVGLLVIMSGAAVILLAALAHTPTLFILTLRSLIYRFNQASEEK